MEYDADLRLGQVFNCTSATLRNGLLPPATPRDFPFKNVSWSTAAAGQQQSLIGPDVSWAQLVLLTSLPAVDFSAAPQIEVAFPQGSSVVGVVDVKGNVAGGIIPTYVRLLFYQVPSLPCTQQTPRGRERDTPASPAADGEAFLLPRGR